MLTDYNFVENIPLDSWENATSFFPWLTCGRFDKPTFSSDSIPTGLPNSLDLGPAFPGVSFI